MDVVADRERDRSQHRGERRRKPEREPGGRSEDGAGERDRGGEPRKRAGYAERAQELRARPRPAHEQRQGREIAQDDEQAREAVVRRARSAWAVARRHLDHPAAVDPENGGEEAVHAARELRARQELAPIGLEPAAAVVDGHARRARDEPVRCLRRQHAREKRLLAREAPPAGDVDAGPFERGEEPRNVARVVLPVAVEGHHDRAARVGEARRERRGLAEVPVEVDDAEVRILGRKRAEAGERRVGAAVVDENDLVGAADAGGNTGDLGEEGVDVALLVVDRHDDRERRSLGGIRHRKKRTTASATRSTSASVKSGWTGRERISCAACSTRGRLGPAP